MKFLFASDSFKGTLSSRRTAELLTRAAQEIFPDCECGYLEVADGGEGTTEAVLSAMPVVSIPDERESGNNAVESGSITVESAVFSESPPLGTVSWGKPVGTSRI